MNYDKIIARPESGSSVHIDWDARYQVMETLPNHTTQRCLFPFDPNYMYDINNSLCLQSSF